MPLAPHDAQAIAQRFGLGEGAVLSGPVARGWVGQVWRLTTAMGVWAVKETFEPPPWHEVVDHAVHQELVAAAGVDVPAVCRTLEGEVLAPIDGTFVRVYGWVDLLAADPWIDPVAVGEVVARIHRVHYLGVNPVDPWYSEPVGAETWQRLVTTLTVAGAPFADRLASQLDDIVALEAYVASPEVVQSCHRDLFADNVLRQRDGGLCVIDWENGGLADPSEELAVVLFEFGCDQPDRIRLLYEAYLDACGPGRVRGPRQFSMLIAQLGHIAASSCRRWLDPTRAAERDLNGERIEEFLTRRLTLQSMDLVLSAVSIG